MHAEGPGRMENQRERAMTGADPTRVLSLSLSLAQVCTSGTGREKREERVFKKSIS